MAFVSLIFKALSLKKLQKTLIEEKLEAIRAKEDKSFKKKFKFRHIGVDLKVGVKRFFKKLFRCSEKCPLHKTCYKLHREGSCENYVLKSIFGFLSGILLTYILYIFFIFQLNVKLTTATVVCSFLGCVLTVGLAYSSKVRCIVLLTLPQFFSKRGRQALLAYAFALALTGPAQNTLNNMGILSESLACGQEQLKQAVKQIIDVIKKPFVAIKDAIKKVIKTIKEVVKKIKEILLKIKRSIMALVRIIKSVFEFLGKIVNICNKELGTPFERCTRVFENAIADCNAKLGPLFNWLCSITYIVKAVCYIVKVFDYVCMLVDFISDSVVGVVIRKVKIFIRHIKTMFYVRIRFSHSFEFQTTSSKSITEIAKEIVGEIKGRSRALVAFFNFMTSAVMLFFLYLVFQVTYYRFKYLTNERFDNIYITKYFRQIDQRRAKLSKETVLPLTKSEVKIYVPISSCKLAKTESKKLSKAMVALATASVKLGTHMVADYSLYWILTMITYHGRYQSKIQAPNLPVAHVSGEGFIATLLRAIVNAFQPVGIKLEIDTVPCLPIPIPPDYDRYVQIGITLLICWILTVLEPYGLRFRNYIMGYYHPVRAKQRTIWLYNHILRYRSSFLLFARRQLKRKFGGKGIEEVSCKDHIRAKLNCSIFRICFGSDLQIACMLCGEVFREKNKRRYIKCHTPGCPGIFCLECFEDLKNICPICLSPIEYGDVEDEEEDSSGDEPPKKPKKRRCPWFPCGKPGDDDKEPLIPEKEDDEYEEEEKDFEEKDVIDEETKEEHKQDELKIAEESDSSTDYSYSYQYDEDQQQPYPKTVPFKDIEKQDIPDYASMESFREEEELLCVDLDNRIRVPKGHKALIEMDVTAHFSDQELDKATECADFPKENEESEHLLEDLKDTPQCVCPESPESSSPRHVEFVGLPRDLADIHKKVKRKVRIIPDDSLCCCSDLELLEHFEDTTFITLPKSTMSTSTRTDCKYCRAPQIASRLEVGYETEEELRNIIPPLDLSFLDKEPQTCTCDNPILSHRFRNVTYQEICETPPSSISQRSLASSSMLTGLDSSSPEAPTEKPLLRKRNVGTQCKATFTASPSSTDGTTKKRQHNVKTQYSVPREVDSPSSMDSFDFNRTQNRRVKHYYETTNKLPLNNRSQYPTRKRSIRDMFRSLMPKRKSGRNYLPLHRHEIDDAVQIQSYNYCDENWETLSLDTDSPTYPFGTQISSDTSEEDQHLLGGRRIRGGECTHLINCKSIGIPCSQKRVRSFDAKSRTPLKDFSTLSLPPKPKPANTKELLERYFQKISEPNVSSTLKFSMKAAEANKSVDPADRKDTSDYIINKSAVSTLTLKEDSTPPSSESGLSEDTCQAIFGGTCPRGLGKSLDECHNTGSESLIALTESSKEEIVEAIGEKKESKELTSSLLEASTSSKKVSVTEGSSKPKADHSRTSQISRDQRGSESLHSHRSSVIPVAESIELDQARGSKQKTLSLELSRENQEDIEKVKRSESRNSKDHSKLSLISQISNQERHLDKAKSTESYKIKDRLRLLSIEEIESKPSKIVEEPSFTAQTSKQEETKSADSNIRRESAKLPSQESFRRSISEVIQDPLSTSKISTQSASKVRSAQLNQLLYKDDKTEISLVQKLSPDKGVIKSQPAFRSSLSPRGVPSVKLQISLHNSIIQEEPAIVGNDARTIAMKTPKSTDKIVETQETYPLRQDWISSNSSRSGKLILASDKTQQTSDNDLYQSSDNTLHSSSERRVSSTVRPSSAIPSSTSIPSQPRGSHTSDQRYSSSDPKYSSSDAYCFNEEPERDLSKKRTCKCSLCQAKQTPRNRTDLPLLRSTQAHPVQGKCSYNCCRCSNRFTDEMTYPAEAAYREPSPPLSEMPLPARPRERSYLVNTYPPSATETESPPFLPPPPPRPPHPPRASRRRSPPQPRSRPYREQCYEGCNCCSMQRHSHPIDYAGDYNQASSSGRRPEPRRDVGYDYVLDYEDISDDDQYDYARRPSLTELPYQNNEEYLELVEELQDTLHTRNKNRVKRAMQEFENRSKQNKPLEKPIINYDEASESEEPIIRKIDQLRTERNMCCAEERCDCNKRNRRPGYSEGSQRKGELREDSFDTNERPSHWTMDPSSGEWSKACKCSRYRVPKGARGRGEPNQCTCNCVRSRYQ